MGIDDRDYMRERYRDRQRKASGTIIWNDRKARVEQPHDKHGKAVPLGSDTASRGFDYQKNRHRPKQHAQTHPMQKWIFLLCAMPILIPAYREAKRSGWFPDRVAELPFPASGTVTVK
ncbi:hypothetical protein [Sphingomonas sp. Leaf28]|uniref:hypothetical protein n=1 Tax=Sphingomonas sp. Leaf28 TaxID=1735695 RepID=UPI001F3A1551|nr:hypothetical protein [Sphingomonas sp. Leaf28]